MNSDDNVYRIALIGDCGVGKSSLIKRYLKESTRRESATVGLDAHELKVVVDSETVTLLVFDCSGDKKFRNYCSTALAIPKGVILAYNVVDRKSLENLLHVWLKTADDYIDKNDVQDVSIFIVGNKVDLRATSDETAVKRAEGESIAVAQSASAFFETSAETGECVDELFQKVASTLIETWGAKDVKPTDQNAKASKKKKRFRKLRKNLTRFCCCCCVCCRKQKTTDDTKQNTETLSKPKSETESQKFLSESGAPRSDPKSEALMLTSIQLKEKEQNEPLKEEDDDDGGGECEGDLETPDC